MEKAAIYQDNSFSNELVYLSVDKVRYTPKARNSTVPLENGQAVFDNRVKDPAEVSVTCRCERRWGDSGFAALRMMYENGGMYSVTDGMGLAIDGLVLKTAPYNRSPEAFDLAIIELVFDRPIIVNQGGNPSNGDNSNFTSLGYAHGVQK